MTVAQNDVIAWFTLLKEHGYRNSDASYTVIRDMVRFSLSYFSVDELIAWERAFYTLPQSIKFDLIRSLDPS